MVRPRLLQVFVVVLSAVARKRPPVSELGHPTHGRRGARADIAVAVTVLSALGLPASSNGEDTRGLIGHWPLAGDARDVSGQRRDAVATGVKWDAVGPSGRPASAARFDGRSAFLELPAASAPKLGTGDFSLSLWMNTPTTRDDVPGDLVSQYDAARRRGFRSACGRCRCRRWRSSPAAVRRRWSITRAAGPPS